jgi:hypothetical protein
VGGGRRELRWASGKVPLTRERDGGMGVTCVVVMLLMVGDGEEGRGDRLGVGVSWPWARRGQLPGCSPL